MSRPLAHTRVSVSALILVWSVAVLLAIGPAGATSTSTTVVSATIPSATTLGLGGCPTTSLSLGLLTSGVTSTTPAACSVNFGSSNDTARLRMYQSDGRGAAMGSFDPTFTTQRGGPGLNDAAMASPTIGWLVGYPARPSDPQVIVRTLDGGTSWVDQTPCAGAVALQEIDPATTTNAVTVGYGNTICYTMNGGATWLTPTAMPIANNWTGVDMLPSGEGFAVGFSGAVAHTLDGGATWASLASLPPPYSQLALLSISAASATRLYAGGYTYAAGLYQAFGLTSGDGGATWSVTTLGGPTASVTTGRSVAAISTTSAVLSTDIGTYSTIDSGATWQLRDPSPGLALAVITPSTWMTFEGLGYPTRRTTDGGANWSTVPVNSSSLIMGAASGGASSVLAAGLNDLRAASIDGGLTFATNSSPYRDLHGVAAWSADRFVAVGANAAVRWTTDGGASFGVVTAGAATTLRSVRTLAGGVAIAVGDGGAIRRTTTWGATWATIPSGTAAGLLAAETSPDGTVYAAGAGGVLVRSTDAGLTWTQRTAPFPSSIQALSSPRDGVVWATGSAGDIARSDDGGASWTAQASGATSAIVGIDSLDGIVAFASVQQNASQTPQVLRTTNGGATWSVAWTGPAGQATFGVQLADPSTIFTYGLSGYLVRSLDAGATWSPVSSTIVASIDSAAAVDGNSIVAVGANDTIARTVQVSEFTDYAAGAADFTGAASIFGACLETAASVASTSWTVAGAGNCLPANVANWRAIPVDRAAATSTVAQTASGVATGSAAFRFGAKMSPTQTVGAYSAGLTFEVVAPDV